MTPKLREYCHFSGSVGRPPRAAGKVLPLPAISLPPPVLGVVFVAVCLCLAITQTAAAERVTLRYGQIPSTVRSVSSLHLFIARERGFYARENVELELIPIPGGTDRMVAALDQATIDVTQTATPYLIQAVLRGSDAAAIAGETANPIYSLVASPEISSFAQLKGKVLGLCLPADTISISIRKLLALKGLNATDYSVKELVGAPVRFECLKCNREGSVLLTS
jgi:ABC-type nitrate/sulfonate/bicarbonate transport system substrate-binding protein